MEWKIYNIAKVYIIINLNFKYNFVIEHQLQLLELQNEYLLNYNSCLYSLNLYKKWKRFQAKKFYSFKFWFNYAKWEFFFD